MVVSFSEQCCSRATQSVACHDVHVGDTCPDLVVDVKGPSGEAVDLRGWTAVGRVFFNTKLADDALATDLTWVLRAGEEKTYAIVGDIVTTTDCDSEIVSVIGKEDCTEIVVSRASSGGFDHVSGAALTVFRGATTAAVLVETELVDEEDPLTYELDGVAYVGDVHQQPDGTWWTDETHSVDSEPLVVSSGSEELISSRVRVFLNATVTAVPGKFLVTVVLTGPDSETATLPRSSAGFCLRVLS